MAGTSTATSPGAADASTLIVLMTSDTVGVSPDVALLRGTIAHAETKVRVLVLAMDDDGIRLAKSLVDGQVELELLVGSDVSIEPSAVTYARMPPGTKPENQVEFALALADVVLADRHCHGPDPQRDGPDPQPRGPDLVARARRLGKPVIAPGMGLPSLPPIRSVSEKLDPQARPRPGRRHFFAGRIEQFSIELLGLLVPQVDSFGDRLGRVIACLRFNGEWGPKSWFPRECKDTSPDTRGYDESSALVRRFEALDRSAVLGAYRHRDLTWVAHFGGAWAVLAAVVGAVLIFGGKHGDAAPGAVEHVSPWIIFWGAVELALLMLVVGIVLGLQHRRLQGRWTACRLGAEQLRIARMCLPLLVLQKALISPDVWPDHKPPVSTVPDLTLDVLTEVKRAIRDHGLPRPDPSGAPEKAARWVKCIVDDQIGYHEKNHRKLRCAERSLRWIADLAFLAAFTAVVVQLVSHFWHCLPDPPWLLLLTAAGPAFAGAFHGAATRLAIAQRIALSRDVEAELRPIQQSLAEIIRRPEVKPEVWTDIRDLTFRAAEAMGRENQSWLGLVRLQQDTLPA
jgi:hypothetical protein